jgi:hypothetical protein
MRLGTLNDRTNNQTYFHTVCSIFPSFVFRGLTYEVINGHGKNWNDFNTSFQEIKKLYEIIFNMLSVKQSDFECKGRQAQGKYLRLIKLPLVLWTYKFIEWQWTLSSVEHGYLQLALDAVGDVFICTVLRLWLSLSLTAHVWTDFWICSATISFTLCISHPLGSSASLNCHLVA